jgi:hypothetical protein
MAAEIGVVFIVTSSIWWITGSVADYSSKTRAKTEITDAWRVLGYRRLGKPQPAAAVPQRVAGPPNAAGPRMPNVDFPRYRLSKGVSGVGVLWSARCNAISSGDLGYLPAIVSSPAEVPVDLPCARS